MIAEKLKKAGKPNILFQDLGELYPWWVQSSAPNTIIGDTTADGNNCIELISETGTARAATGLAWQRGERVGNYPDDYRVAILLNCPVSTDDNIPDEQFYFKVGNLRGYTLTFCVGSSTINVYDGTTWVEVFSFTNIFINQWVYIWFDVSALKAELSVWWWGKSGATVVSDIDLWETSPDIWIRIGQKSPAIDTHTTYIDAITISRV